MVAVVVLSCLYSRCPETRSLAAWRAVVLVVVRFSVLLVTLCVRQSCRRATVKHREKAYRWRGALADTPHRHQGKATPSGGDPRNVDSAAIAALYTHMYTHTRTHINTHVHENTHTYVHNLLTHRAKSALRYICVCV